MPSEAQSAGLPVDEKGTHGQILKSSAWIGGSSLLTIAFGIVRTKAMALNPAGFGLFGIYGSISGLAQCIAGVGINSSGVRQIAAAVGSGDSRQVAHTAAVIQRTSALLGVLGAVLLAAFSRRLSIVTFGSPQHAGPIVLLSLAVFFQLVANGQNALLQGVRRIRELGKAAVLSAILGGSGSLLLVYFLRERGVALSLVVAAIASCAVSWWYARGEQFQCPSLRVAQIAEGAAPLLKLGLVFMTSYLMTQGTAYAVRVILLRYAGFDATGYYQSAWTLGGLYVGFILEAMGADFYPRIAGCAEDNGVCNRLVNEQTHVGLLLAGPGVIATLTLAPAALVVFYSTRFAAAAGVLRWICLGTLLQVIAWPMSYMIVAKNKRALYFATELTWGVLNLGLSWICIRAFGLNGAGIAFFGSNALFSVVLFPVARRLTNFGWSSATRRTGLFFLSLIGLAFSASCFLPLLWATAVGVLATLLSAIYSVQTVARLVSSEHVSWEHVPPPLRRLLVILRLAPPSGRDR